MKLLPVLAAVSVSYSALTIAQTERELESHVHGSATLNVAITDSSLFVELNSPWNNLIGFEHSPETQEQHKLFDDALKLLNEPAQLLSFDGGKCTHDDTVVESAMADESHGDEHKDGHEDEHEDGHGEAHDDADGHEEETQSHTTVLVTYSYQCKDIGKLKAIDLKLFSLWPGFVDLDVQLVGPAGQALVELIPENTILDIAQVL